MDIDWTRLFVEVLIMLGAGGVGGAIVNGYFNRHKSTADAQKIQAEAEQIADKQIIDGFGQLLDRITGRMDKLDARIAQLENEIKGRDMLIAELTEENRRLNVKVDELERERTQQVETNRRQGDLISELRKRIVELEARLNCDDTE